MATVFDASKEDATILRAAFGPAVARVVFWDADFPDEDADWWELAVAENAAGQEIGRSKPGDETWPQVSHVTSGKGVTVKFWIELP